MRRHPDPWMAALIDQAAKQITESMTPLQKGLLLYPDARPRALADIPASVMADHLDRYTMQDLKDGQFMEVLPGKYTFLMGQETKVRKDRESASSQDGHASNAS